VNFKKYEIDVLDDQQWEVVLSEIRGRAALVAAAERSGAKSGPQTFRRSSRRPP